LALALTLLPTVALADRRYFLETYTPYLGEPGESEVELWLTSKTGKQDPAEAATLEGRAEWEYGLSDRWSGALYLNLSRPPGGQSHLDSGSLELIYRPIEQQGLPLDPALYLEITESGKELELEPKLLLAHRFHSWIAAANLIGEFEFRHNDNELLANGDVLENQVAGEISAGVAYDLHRQLAVGVEGLARTEHPNFGPQAAALFSLGPTLTVQLGEAQLGLEMLQQIRGTPRTSGNLNLVDFEKTQWRLVLGFDL
jgi:hypothetical protein